MKDQGVDPDFVLVFIGPSVKYLSTLPSVETEQAAGGVLMEIESNVEALATLGVKQEVCAVATRVFGIDNKTLLLLPFPDHQRRATVQQLRSLLITHTL
jgi:hypothetical protein